MSIARANKNKPNVWRDFFYKNNTEIKPPTKPANNGIYRRYYSPMYLLKQHKVNLNSITKLPTKSPNLMASFPVSMLKRCFGLENIFFKLKTVDIPALMR